LRALSSAYVERRGRLGHGAALDGAGKRAAFALFYGPLHFLLARHIVTTLGAACPGPQRIVDLGCGTGVVGAAWAMVGQGPGSVLGLDVHPWAVDESRWTYRQLGVDGNARRGDISRLDLGRPPDAIVAGYALNELDDGPRETVLAGLMERAAGGTAVLVIEPIARTITPWMTRWAARAAATGGRHDEWRVTLELPAIVKRLELASGLDRSEVTARTLYWPATGKAGRSPAGPERGAS
jgi:SAM-dependent methyltransferase